MEIRVDGQRVKQLREAKLWTQEDLAEHARVHARTVQRVETLGGASAHTLRAIAVALDVDPRSLEAASEPAPEPAPSSPAEALALPWLGVGAAFLWVALACVAYVPTAPPGVKSSVIAALGFASLLVGLWCLDRRRRQAGAAQ